MRLDNDQLATLARFAKTPEGQLVLQVLEDRLVDRDDELRNAANVESVFRAQGKAVELRDVLDLIKGAQTRLNRATPPRSQGARPVLA